jgi:hypothetical protein
MLLRDGANPLMVKLHRTAPVSFELEFLRLDKDGNITVVDREQSPLDLSVAKLKAQQILDGARRRGGGFDAIRIRDASGDEVFLYRDGGGTALTAGFSGSSVTPSAEHWRVALALGQARPKS